MSTETLAPRVRQFIFEHFLEHAAPPVVEQVMGTFSISRAEATDVLRNLEAAGHIALVPGTARILMAFPSSAIATPFQATVRVAPTSRTAHGTRLPSMRCSARRRGSAPSAITAPRRFRSSSGTDTQP